MGSEMCIRDRDAAQRAAMGQSAKEYYLAHYRRSELLRKLEHFILEGRV